MEGGGVSDNICNGSFVLIQRTDEQIEIRTDYCGTRKLYLFRNGDYFAISDSFILLVDQIKTKFRLSLNEDYARYMVGMSLCSLSVKETLINEVQLIPRNFKVFIDIKSQQLILQRIDYKEYFMPLESSEGIQVLDSWFKHWVNIIQNLSEKDANIKTDITGGKDSRLTLSMFLKSGINLNGIKFRSLNDGMAMHPEDYEIASEMAKFYNFQLNQSPYNVESRAFSVEEMVNISFYSKLGFNRNMHFRTGGYSLKPIYRFTGFGSEVMRAYWKSNPERFIQIQINNGNKYRSFNFAKSTEKILRASFEQIDQMFKIYENNYPVPATRLYKETRNRHHFGGIMIEHYIANVLTLAPTMDYNINKLNVPSIDGNPDLLIVLILERYCNSLLNFKLEGGRVFDDKVLEYAKRINQQFPLDNAFFNDSKIVVNSNKTANINQDVKENYDETRKIEEYLLKISNTDIFKSTFVNHFSQEIFMHAQRYSNNIERHSLSRLYVVIAITKALMDVQISKQIEERSIFENLSSMIEDGGYIKQINQSNMIKALFKSLSSARIELMTELESLKKLNVSVINENGQVEELKSQKYGYVLESDSKSLILQIHSEVNTTIELKLLSKEIKGMSQSLKIDYINAMFNDTNLLPQERLCTSKDKPFTVSLPVEKHRNYNIKLNWEVHGYSADEFVSVAVEFLNG